MNLPTLELKPFPYKVYCCFSKEQWAGQTDTWDEVYAGQAVHLTGATCINVYPRMTERVEVVDTIAHEVSHTLRKFFEHIEEHEPSSEFEAYFTGYITGWVFSEWLKAEGRPSQPQSPSSVDHHSVVETQP